MTRLFIILMLVFFISCNNVIEKKEDTWVLEKSKAIQLKLIDSLGMVNFSIPLDYDTSFLWIHYSDCGKPCNEQKYRFQSKNLPIIKESGFMWIEPKDSVERFTISHTMDFPFHDGDTVKNIIRHNHLKEQLMSNLQNPPIIFDTVQKINDRYYSIFEMEKSETIQSKKILAITTIKNNLIKFEYELMTKQKDIGTKFFEKSIEFIKTIRISKGL